MKIFITSLFLSFLLFTELSAQKDNNINGPKVVSTGDTTTYYSIEVFSSKTVTWYVTKGKGVFITNHEASDTYSNDGPSIGTIAQVIWGDTPGPASISFNSSNGKYGYIGVNIIGAKKIENQNFIAGTDTTFSYDSITVKNATINSGALVNINGKSKVQINPDFHAKVGSNVRIYNGPENSSNARAASQTEITNEPLFIKTETEINNEKICLYQNSPNPFNGQSSINYYIPENVEGEIQIKITTLMGQYVKTFKITEIGYGEITLNASEFSPGIYLYSLTLGGKLIDTKRMEIK
ncbi:MAG: T9SS type A sorting domain-containing protein [Bacteroidales bacterium]|nr:T9SS type A sorting domain-containing protein [Bacteroidales bacterium]